MSFSRKNEFWNNKFLENEWLKSKKNFDVKYFIVRIYDLK